MQKSQMLWLEKSFRDKYVVEIDNKQFFDKFNKRLLAVSRIQKLTLDHTRTMLESQAGKHSMAERMLICQLLVDLETSFSTSSSSMASTQFEQEFEFLGDQRNLAALLCQTGDYNGALTLLHKIPRKQIGNQDLSRIVEIGTLLCARTKTIPEVLGTDDDRMYSAVFECMDVLVFPYNLLDEHSGQGTSFGEFIGDSFMWPWQRRSICTRLKNVPGAPMDLSQLRLDPQFRDDFGHSLLHAAAFSQDYYASWKFIQKSLDCGQENAMAQLETTWPSYARGFTPLASSVSALAGRGSMDNWNFFDALLSFSNGDLCCGSRISTPRHEFCAIAFAIRCPNTKVVESLLQRAVEQGADISDCCHSVMNWRLPYIGSAIRDLLVVYLCTPA